MNNALALVYVPRSVAEERDDASWLRCGYGQNAIFGRSKETDGAWTNLRTVGTFCLSWQAAR